MLKNYLIIALRSLRRHKAYAAINVTGLAVGIACCLLILLYVRDELSYDHFHAKSDRIVRVLGEGNYSGERRISAITSLLLGPALKASLPEVDRFVRLYPEDGIVRIDEQRFQEDVLLVDTSFFKVFSFPLKYGEPGTALTDPNGLVLSEATAHRLFGAENPVGQTLSIRLEETFHDFTVQGVAQPIPQASSIRFDVLMPIEKLADYDPSFLKPSWRSLRPRTYLQLTEAARIEDVAAKLPVFVQANLPEDLAAHAVYHLQPLSGVHLDPDVHGGLQPTSNPLYAYLLSGIAFFILLIACINFTTLMLGRSTSRVREVGVRKVVGAVRTQLMKQFWGEALLISFVALLVGIALVEVLLPVFNALVEKELSLREEWGWLPLLGGLLVLVSLLAGSYPAVYLSRFRPAEVLKGSFVAQGKSRLTQALVVVQFALSIFFVSTTLLMSQQLDLLLDSNMGFDEAHTVRIQAEYGSTYEGAEVLERYRARLANEPSIRELAGSMYAVGGAKSVTNRFGMVSETDTVPGYALSVTETFVETLGFELVQGRAFSEDRPADVGNSVVVNEALVRAFGWEDPIGKPLSRLFDFENATVIGVVKDFHYESLHRPIEPLAMYVGERPPVWHIYARVAPGQATAALAALEQAWHAVTPDLPFDFTFVNQEVDRLYRTEQRWATLIRYASALTIFVSCLGLLGLAGLAAARRRKEIGIRKVLGATVPQIVGLLTTRFAILVLFALCLAAPVAYIAMQRWLQDFAYRIEISGWIFLMAGLTALGVALLTVSYQSIKAALADPVQSLRYE